MYLSSILHAFFACVFVKFLFCGEKILGGQTSPTGILKVGQKIKNPENGCFFRPFWTSLRIPWPGHTWRGCNTPPPRRRCTSSEVVTAAMAAHNLHPRACVVSVYRVLSWGVCPPGPVVHAGAGGGHRALVGVQWAAMVALLVTTGGKSDSHLPPRRARCPLGARRRTHLALWRQQRVLRMREHGASEGGWGGEPRSLGTKRLQCRPGNRGVQGSCNSPLDPAECLVGGVQEPTAGETVEVFWDAGGSTLGRNTRGWWPTRGPRPASPECPGATATNSPALLGVFPP